MADRTLVDIVQAHVARTPHETAMSWVPELSHEPGASLSWSALWHEGERIAGALAQLEWPAGAPRMALLAFPPGLGFIRAFLGCLIAGVTAIPVALPRGGRGAPVLEAIVANCGATLALSTAPEDARLRELFAASLVLAPVRVVALEALPADARPPIARPRSGDLAFVQYTSGSSSQPKGVCVTHANLLANLELIQRDFRITPRHLFVNWLPHYHDMGLIGSLLVPLHGGFPCVAMAPSAFIKRPLRWLQLIAAQDHDRWVLSGGPNFAYQLCVDRIGGDDAAQLSLAHWKTAFNGAEPIRAATLRSFAARFAPAGFDAARVLTCYGLAETTLLATGGHGPAFATVSASALEHGRLEPPATADDARELASSGPDDEARLAIVDRATRRRLSPGRIGEIWITGASVPRCYLNDPAGSERTFAATLADDASGARYLATGDLGAIAGGHLYVTGRAKELLIVHGRNLYPHDVEALLHAADDRIEAAAVFAWDDADATGESAIALCELTRSARQLLAPGAAAASELARLANAMRRAVAAAELTLAHVRFVGPMQIARTSSGKTGYGQLRREFGALPAAVRRSAWSAAGALELSPGEEHDAFATAAALVR
jgi:acyl-CoA synthetase (AMP-forming)/AMP-acid ligase II